MNATKAKQIRKILNFDPNGSDETSKRVYSRLKKQYTKLSKGAKPLFLAQLQKLHQSN
tara:strand:- start:703 stop:876 length:174 start_codon:yes stop_codon:yes gene_type:complete